MVNAKLRPDLVPVEYFAENDTIRMRGIDYTNCKEFFKMVLEFNGKTYTFSGWNSDTGNCYFKVGAAVVARRRR